MTIQTRREMGTRTIYRLDAVELASKLDSTMSIVNTTGVRGTSRSTIMSPGERPGECGVTLASFFCGWRMRMTSSADLGVSPRTRWAGLKDDASHARPDEHKSAESMTLGETRDEVNALRSRIRSAVEAEQARFKDWRARLEAEIADLKYRETRANDRGKREQAKAQRMHTRTQQAESKLAMVRRALKENEHETV